MKLSILTLAACVALAVDIAAAAGGKLSIERYERNINLKTQFVIAIDSITIKNAGSTAAASFQWCTLAEHTPHLAFLSALHQQDGTVPAWQTRQPKPVEGSPEGIDCIHVPTSRGDGDLAPGQTLTLTIQAVYTKLQVPFPKEITQEDPNRVLYKGSLFALSPYEVASQVLSIETYNSEILDYTKREPYDKKARNLAYGEHKNVKPFTLERLQLHYVNNAPFGTAKTLERVLDTNHWGRLDVEERYVIKNEGAKLKGPWSRYDYQREPHRFAQASFRDLNAEAPAFAKHLYFRDAIGNISTSAVRYTPAGIGAALLPRIPLYGGWSTDFVFGFQLPLQPLTKRGKDGRREFVYAFGPHVRGFVVDDLTVRIMLPEGATDITAEVAFEIDLSFEPKYTFLNKVGRTVVVLHARNVVDALNQPFVIRFAMPPFAWLREPALWGGSLAAILAAFVLFARSDFSLVRDSAKSAARGRSQAATVAQRASAIFAERRRALVGLETVFDTPGARAEDVLLTKKHADAVLLSSSEKLRDAHRKLGALAGAARAGELQALMDREAAAASASLRLFAQRLEVLRRGAAPSASSTLQAQQSEITSTRKEVAAAVEELYTAM